MGEHFALCVDRLITSDSLQTLEESKSAGVSGSDAIDPSASVIDIKEHEERGDDEAEPLIQTMECRICQEEDSVKNLEIPCACNGSLKFAHRACVQRWCDEKRGVICEICNQSYQPGYTAPPPLQPEDSTIEISGGWRLAGAPLDLNDPRLLAMAAAERRFLEADYDEYANSSATGAAFCRSAALILIALLLLRHALTIGNGDEDDDDVTTFFSLFMLRAAGFLLPCYILAWAISILQRRRQRQEAAAIAAAEIAFLLQASQHRGFQVTVASAATTPTTSPPSSVPVATQQEALPNARADSSD